uniref:Uncharacterized protein n=1 Tax=Kalanchoe fedtschenkoi TaxID=63787 RepID=A0A7N0VIC6_KALFE
MARTCVQSSFLIQFPGCVRSTYISVCVCTCYVHPYLWGKRRRPSMPLMELQIKSSNSLSLTLKLLWAYFEIEPLGSLFSPSEPEL